MTTVRIADLIDESIARAHKWAIDQGMSGTLLDDILEGVNNYIATLKGQGIIVDGQAWIDPEINTKSVLSSGQLYVDYDFTDAPPLERLSFRSLRTTRYISQILPTV